MDAAPRPTLEALSDLPLEEPLDGSAARPKPTAAAAPDHMPAPAPAAPSAPAQDPELTGLNFIDPALFLDTPETAGTSAPASPVPAAPEPPTDLTLEDPVVDELLTAPLPPPRAPAPAKAAEPAAFTLTLTPLAGAPLAMPAPGAGTPAPTGAAPPAAARVPIARTAALAAAANKLAAATAAGQRAPAPAAATPATPAAPAAQAAPAAKPTAPATATLARPAPPPPAVPPVVPAARAEAASFASWASARAASTAAAKAGPAAPPHAAPLAHPAPVQPTAATSHATAPTLSAPMPHGATPAHAATPAHVATPTHAAPPPHAGNPVRAAPHAVPAPAPPAAAHLASAPATLPAAPGSATTAKNPAPRMPAANAAAAPALAMSPPMDRDFIARNQVVERYLSGRLPLKGATDFERFCHDHPELLDEIGLPERVNAGLRLLEASGKPEPWDEAARPLWQRPKFTLSLCAAVVALGVAFGLLANRYVAKNHRIAELQKQVFERALDPATSTREIRLLPSRSGASNTAAITIGGGAVQLADFKIDESRSPYHAFRVTIDRIDQGRVAIINNLAKDANGHLRIALNSSALGPGNYQLTIEGLGPRGEPEPDSWITIGVQR